MPTLTKEALAGVRRSVGCMTRLVTENGMIGSPASSNLQTTHNGKSTERTEAHKGEEHALDRNSSPLSLELFESFHEQLWEGDIVGIAGWGVRQVGKLRTHEC